MPDQIYKVSWNGQEKINYTYDGLGRLTNKSVILSASEESQPPRLNNQYTYIDVGTDKTTTLVQSVQTAAGTYTYTYDAVGNILSVSDGTYTNSYVYDSLNQLVRENNQQIGKTYTYAYVNGNITEKKEYAYTTGELPAQPQNTYTWAYTDSTWSDLLTNFNGTAISYDEIGNPVSLDDVQLSWNGRQLQQITGAEGEILSYCYNTDGQRISKTMTETNGTVTTTEFFYNGSILAGQKCGDNTLVFMYDNNGQYYGFTYNGATYYYLTNIQGDVEMVLNSSRAVVAKYAYDAWGNVVSGTDADGNDITDMSHIGHINPIRYRGYYYDAETELYYLNSRYYMPVLCRFLNGDAYASTGEGLLSNNMFAYCLNNPVNFSDPNGTRVHHHINGPYCPVCGWRTAPWENSNSSTNTSQNQNQKPSSNCSVIADVAKSTSSTIATTTANYVIVKGIESLSYKSFVPITNFTNVSTGTIKNICATFNNSLYSSLCPYLNDLKIVGKTPGIATIAAFTIDVYMDYCKYGENANDFNKAITVTTFTTVACVSVGLVCSGFGAPAGVALFTTVFAGCVFSYCSYTCKQIWIGY